MMGFEKVFKLIPLPKHDLLMLVPFSSAEKACEAVGAVFREGIIPSAMEFMERDAIEWSAKYSGELNFEIKPDWQALLLIEVDGNNMDVLMSDCEKISEIMQIHGSDEVLFAEGTEQKNALWKIRRKIFTMQLPAGQLNYRLPVSNLPAGPYILSLHSPEQVIFQKFIRK